MEIYLNQIYLGRSSHGIYVAAQNYFGKRLEDLSVAEAALLASLPKAPSKLNPYENYQKAINRRNWSINRMREEGYIDLCQESEAVQQPINLSHSKIKNKGHENLSNQKILSNIYKFLRSDDFYRAPPQQPKKKFANIFPH